MSFRKRNKQTNKIIKKKKSNTRSKWIQHTKTKRTQNKSEFIFFLLFLFMYHSKCHFVDNKISIDVNTCSKQPNNNNKKQTKIMPKNTNCDPYKKSRYYVHISRRSLNRIQNQIYKYWISSFIVGEFS